MFEGGQLWELKLFQRLDAWISIKNSNVVGLIIYKFSLGGWTENAGGVNAPMSYFSSSLNIDDLIKLVEFSKSKWVL